MSLPLPTTKLGLTEPLLYPKNIILKSIELRKAIRILKSYGIIYVTGKGRHPKFYDPETHKSYPIKSHGKKTLILSYALDDLIDKFDLPADVFHR